MGILNFLCGTLVPIKFLWRNFICFYFSKQSTKLNLYHKCCLSLCLWWYQCPLPYFLGLTSIKATGKISLEFEWWFILYIQWQSLYYASLGVFHTSAVWGWAGGLCQFVQGIRGSTFPTLWTPHTPKALCSSGWKIEFSQSCSHLHRSTVQCEWACFKKLQENRERKKQSQK